MSTNHFGGGSFIQITAVFVAAVRKTSTECEKLSFPQPAPSKGCPFCSARQKAMHSRALESGSAG